MEKISYPPVYFAGCENEDPELFLENLTAYANLLKITNPGKLLPLALKEGARTWYLNLEKNIKSDFKAFKETFLQRYSLPPFLHFRQTAELFNLQQQKDEHVRDYISRIMHRARQVNMSEDVTIQALLYGLLPDLKSHVLIHAPKTIAEFEQHALKAHHIQPKDRDSLQAAIEKLKADIECYAAKSHRFKSNVYRKHAKGFRNRENNFFRKDFYRCQKTRLQGRCFKCQKYGHLQKVCTFKFTNAK